MFISGVASLQNCGRAQPGPTDLAGSTAEAQCKMFTRRSIQLHNWGTFIKDFMHFASWMWLQLLTVYIFTYKNSKKCIVTHWTLRVAMHVCIQLLAAIPAAYIIRCKILEGENLGEFDKLQEIRQNFPSQKLKYSVYSYLYSASKLNSMLSF